MEDFKYIPKHEGRKIIRKDVSECIELADYTDIDLATFVDDLNSYLQEGANRIDFTIDAYDYDDKELSFQCFEVKEESEDEYLDRIKKEHDAQLKREEHERVEEHKEYLKAKEIYLKNKDRFE